MSATSGLGYRFNVGVSVTTAKTRFNMRDADHVTIVCVGATGATNLTLNECNAASGGTEQALAVVTTYWSQAAVGTVTAWVKNTQAAASTVPVANGGVTVFEVSGVSMSDGFKYLDVTHASCTAIFILNALDVHRAPDNLVSAIL